MGLRIRRGSDEARANSSLEQGELVWTSSQGTTGANYHQLWVGTGIGTGGVNILETSAGFGLTWDPTTQRLEVSGLTADDIGNGVNNKYFTTELAVDAVGAALVAGNATNVGITFTYSQTQDDAGRINATVALDGVGITEVSEDTTPQLGGNLDLNENDITGTGNIDLTGDISASGTTSTLNLTVDGFIGSTTIPPLTAKSNNIVAVGSNATPNTLWINSTQNFGVFNGISDGTGNSSAISFRISRGSLASKTAVAAGDPLISLDAFGYDGTEFLPVGGLIVAADPDAVVATGSVPSAAALVTVSAAGDPNFAKLDSKGTFSVPVMQVGAYTSSPETRPTGVKGMIIFNDTSGKFQGFNGSAWVDLS